MMGLGSFLSMPWGKKNLGAHLQKGPPMSDFSVLLSGSGLWGVICVGLFSNICLIEELYSGLCFCCSSILPVSQLATCLCKSMHSIMAANSFPGNVSSSSSSSSSSRIAPTTQCIYQRVEYPILVMDPSLTASTSLMGLIHHWQKLDMSNSHDCILWQMLPISTVLYLSYQVFLLQVTC